MIEINSNLCYMTQRSKDKYYCAANRILERKKKKKDLARAYLLISY